MEMEFRTLEDYIPQKEMGKVFHPPEAELRSAYTNYREAKVSNVTAYPRTQAPESYGFGSHSQPRPLLALCIRQ